MQSATINIVSDFRRIDLIGVNHLYYEFNQDEKNGEVILFLNLHEHYNNIELFKVALFCRKNKVKLTAYTHLNEFPLVSTFADAAILYNRDDHNIYEGISRYNYDHGLVGGIFNESLSHSVRECWSLGRVANKEPLFLKEIQKEISDEEVVEEFSFPQIYIRKQAYEKYNVLQEIGFLKNDLIMCEVKESPDCGGAHLLESIKKQSENFEIYIETNKDFNRKMFSLCGQDYMGVQVLASFLNNWMWICYGGSCNIFPFFPVKILSMADQTVLKDLNRKISVSRFGDIGNLFPEFETWVYCLPGNDQNEVADIRQGIRDFLRHKNSFVIKNHD